MPRACLVVSLCALMGMPSLACGDHERAADLEELLGRSVLRIAGHEPNLYGDGEVVVVEVELLDDVEEGDACPVFDAAVEVSGRTPVQLAQGNWSGWSGNDSGAASNVCLTGIWAHVRWADAFEEELDVRIWDDSATLRAVYRAPERPSIVVWPTEAYAGESVEVALQPVPREAEALAGVRLVDAAGRSTDLGLHDVVEGVLRFEVPDLPTGSVRVWVRVEGWTRSLVACEGPARCDPPTGFLEAGTLAAANLSVR